MDSTPLLMRVVSFIKRAVVHLLFRLKRFLAQLAQSLQRDELRELTNEARVLGSASAESIDHVGAELREVNERLSKLERDVERIGRLLEDRNVADRAAEPRDEPRAQPLSTD
jgi:hypothetical protein